MSCRLASDGAYSGNDDEFGGSCISSYLIVKISFFAFHRMPSFTKLLQIMHILSKQDRSLLANL